MVEASELLRLPVFANLPEDQVAWFIAQSQEIALRPDEVYIHEGDPADAMFVILEGQVQARGELGGSLLTFVSEPGDVGGLLPFSRMKQFLITVRALTTSRALRFPAALFPALVQKMPELTGRLV